MFERIIDTAVRTERQLDFEHAAELAQFLPERTSARRRFVRTLGIHRRAPKAVPVKPIAEPSVKPVAFQRS